MADKLVRTHTNQSNRSKAKEALERKTVFRSVLDNPFRIQCVPVNVQNTILARVVGMLQGVPEYRAEREKHIRKKRKAMRPKTALPPSKRRKFAFHSHKPDDIAADSDTMERIEATEDGTNVDSENDILEPRPDILDRMTTGINEVTKLLERTARVPSRATIGTAPSKETTSEARPAIILVCRGDVTPPDLIQHIPHLVAACNTRRIGTNAPLIHLVPLPRGAESSLAEAIGLRRVSVVALHVDAPSVSDFTPLLANVPSLGASWLAAPANANRSLIPTHIKQLKTTVPKDMRAAKEQRSRGRADAKARKRGKLPQKAQEPAANEKPTS